MHWEDKGYLHLTRILKTASTTYPGKTLVGQVPPEHMSKNYVWLGN